MSPFLTHQISSYMRVLDCILHRFELSRCDMNLSYLLEILRNEEASINCAGVVKRLETCLSPSSAFNLFLFFLTMDR
jgi:hypothetical protein